MAGGRLEKVDARARRLYCSMESRNQREMVLLSRRLSQFDNGAVSTLEKHLEEMALVGDRLKRCRQSSGWMPTAVRPTRDDRAGWMTTAGATRRPWSNFRHYTTDDWPTESVVSHAAGVRPCTVGAPGRKRYSTNETSRRPTSAAPGRDHRGARFKHRVVSPDSTEFGDKIDDMSDGVLSDDSSDGEPEKETPTQKGAITGTNSITSTAYSERRCAVQAPDQLANTSRESTSICRRDIDNDIKSLWDVGVATKKTMRTMMYLNNGLALPPSHKCVSLAGRNRRGQLQVDQGFSKTTRRKPNLPPFHIKPQHRHKSANVFLATRYAALQRNVSSDIPPESATVDTGANITVAFSKLARTQILRRLQERNDIKVETKRKLKESTQIQAKMDSFIKSLTKFVQTNE